MGLTLGQGSCGGVGQLWLRWTSIEGVVDDRCASDGSPCVHAGRINSGRYGRRAKLEGGVTLSKRNDPGVWVPSRRLRL